MEHFITQDPKAIQTPRMGFCVPTQPRVCSSKPSTLCLKQMPTTCTASSSSDSDCKMTTLSCVLSSQDACAYFDSTTHTDRPDKFDSVWIGSKGVKQKGSRP